MKNLLLAITMSALWVSASWAAPTVQVIDGETRLIFFTDATDEFTFSIDEAGDWLATAFECVPVRVGWTGKISRPGVWAPGARSGS